MGPPVPKPTLGHHASQGPGRLLLDGTQSWESSAWQNGERAHSASNPDVNGFILTLCAYAHASLFPGDLRVGWMATLTARFKKKRPIKFTNAQSHV